MVDAREIGNRLKFLRKKMNVTGMDVCRETGIMQSAYSNYETGARVPRDENKVLLAKYFGVSVDTIFFNEDFTYSEV